MATVMGDGLQNHRTVFTRVYFSPKLSDRSVRCDKESISLIEFHILEGHQWHPVGRSGLTLRIGEQLESQPILSAEALVTLGCIEANAEDDGILCLKFWQIALIGVCLYRASSALVFRV